MNKIKKNIFILFAGLTIQLQAQKNYVYVDSIIQQHEKKFTLLSQDLRKIYRDTVALQYFLEKSKSTFYPEAQILALDMLGKQARINSNYGRALDYYHSALELSKNLSDKSYEIYTLNMIGVVYRRMDAVKSALEFHDKALELALQQNPKTKEIEENIAISHNSIGNIYLLLDKQNLAMDHFRKALEIEKKYHNKLGMAINYQNIGSIYETEGNLEKALEYYQRSLIYNDSINSSIGKIICKTSIANVLLKKDKPESALEIITPIIKTAKKLGDRYYIADVYYNYGKTLLKNNRTIEGEDFLFKSLAIAKQKNYPSIAAEVYKELSNLYEYKNNPSKALRYYKLYNEEQKKVYNEKNRQIVSDLFLKQLKKENESKIQQLDQVNKRVTQKLRQSKTTLYFTFLFLILLGILALILYKQNQLKTERKLMLMEQNLLRAQMNPHFIFNSLNSIKLYIIHKRSKDAISFLSKFAKLIRIILQSTKDKEMSLADEIEMIKLYVSIENIRMDNSIQFNMEIDPGLALEKIKIPSLLTQPFIENALWHGLSQKTEGDRHLNIRIYAKDNKKIFIEIEDNGIGRKRAEEIKKSRIFHKKSLGIRLSSERLKLFSKTFNEEFGINFIDLFDSEGKPAGTRVIIEIPYTQNTYEKNHS